jgi:hypothetical protein
VVAVRAVTTNGHESNPVQTPGRLLAGVRRLLYEQPIRSILSPGTLRRLFDIIGAIRADGSLGAGQEKVLNDLPSILLPVAQGKSRQSQNLNVLAGRLSEATGIELFVGGNKQTGSRIETTEEQGVLSRDESPETCETSAARQAQLRIEPAPVASLLTALAFAGTALSRLGHDNVETLTLILLTS